MQRRNFLIGAAGTAIGGSALVGSGAFTSVEADRSIDVSTAGDQSALLGFEPGDANGQYAVFDDDTLSIEIPKLNKEARTVVRDIFSIRNNSQNNILVQVLEAPEGFGLFADDPARAEEGKDPDEVTTGIGPGGESGEDALQSTEDLGNDNSLSNPQRAALAPGEELGEISGVFTDDFEGFGAEVPIEGEVVFAAQDAREFEEDITFNNDGTVSID